LEDLASLRHTYLGSSWIQRILRVRVWGLTGNSAKEKGSLELVSNYGAQRARFKAQVYQDRKGSNPTVNLLKLYATAVGS
jgi:hypothetical protein